MPRRMFNREPIRKAKALTCFRCGAGEDRLCAIYDRDLDCTVAWRCEGCGHQWKRDLGVVLAVADPQASVDPVSPIHHPCCEKGRV